MIQFYNDEENRVLTQEEIELLKEDPTYRKMINEDIEDINSKINKLVIDRNKSDKIIGLSLGVEISSYLTISSLLINSSLDYNNATFELGILLASIFIRKIKTKQNNFADIKINILKRFKDEIIEENSWLDENEKTYAK